jgi:hypothetical protein
MSPGDSETSGVGAGAPELISLFAALRSRRGRLAHRQLRASRRRSAHLSSVSTKPALAAALAAALSCGAHKLNNNRGAGRHALGRPFPFPPVALCGAQSGRLARSAVAAQAAGRQAGARGSAACGCRPLSSSSHSAAASRGGGGGGGRVGGQAGTQARRLAGRQRGRRQRAAGSGRPSGGSGRQWQRQPHPDLPQRQKERPAAGRRRSCSSC